MLTPPMFPVAVSEIQPKVSLVITQHAACPPASAVAVIGVTVLSALTV